MEIYQDTTDGALYIPIKTELGWIALDLGSETLFGGVHPTKEACLECLSPTGWKINKRDSKPWQGHRNCN